uniref:Uncharacterized protein n=1 Tax=Timema douglasi TaxID=61478 RepID=A0A7R8VU55_TIMDO|nr:unnamed protein product [Timema douglasi]
MLVPNENIPIYNFVSGANTLTFQENTNVLLEKILEVPSAQAIWYPLVIPFRSVLWYRVFAIFVHVIPGALLDIAFVIKGSPPNNKSVPGPRIEPRPPAQKSDTLPLDRQVTKS